MLNHSREKAPNRPLQRPHWRVTPRAEHGPRHAARRWALSLDGLKGLSERSASMPQTVDPLGTVMTVFLPLAALLLIPFLLLSMRSFDRLVRYQHAAHHEDWVRAGEPFGFFWKLPRSSDRAFRRSFAFHRACLAWLGHTPSWASTDPAALQLLRRYRWFVILWHASLALVAVSFFLIMSLAV